MTDPENKTVNDIRDESKILNCSICGDMILPELSGWSGGHNAEPVNDGRCCSDCNTTVVVPMRLRQLQARRNKDFPHV